MGLAQHHKTGRGRGLSQVHRSNAKSDGLFFPVFIHRILVDLGLEDFLASKPVHIISPIGATFLRQRAAQLKASSKRIVSSLLQVMHLEPLLLMILLLRHLWTPQLPWILHHLHLRLHLCVLCWTRFSPFRRRVDSFCWICLMRLWLYKQIWRILGASPPAPPSDES